MVYLFNLSLTAFDTNHFFMRINDLFVFFISLQTDKENADSIPNIILITKPSMLTHIIIPSARTFP